MQELESIKDDIAKVKDRGRQLMEQSDPEGYQAMQATLTMMTDRLDNLQTIAEDKGKQLQVNRWGITEDIDHLNVLCN